MIKKDKKSKRTKSYIRKGWSPDEKLDLLIPHPEIKSAIGEMNTTDKTVFLFTYKIGHNLVIWKICLN